MGLKNKLSDGEKENNNMEEIWKDIEGYEGLYQVSNLGRVKNNKTGNIKKCPLCKNGYNYCGLWKNNIEKQYKVSRLVASAFIPNPNNLPVVNHKNEIKTDNRVENLEWCTYKYNSNYGTFKERMIDTRNKKNSSNKEKEVYQLTIDGDIIAKYKSIAEAARQVGVHQQHIVRVLKGRRKTCGGFKWDYAA